MRTCFSCTSKSFCVHDTHIDTIVNAIFQALLYLKFGILWNSRRKYSHYAKYFFRLTSYLYSYLYQYNLSSIPTVLATIFIWFVSSEFRCLWLVAGNIYVSLMWREGRLVCWMRMTKSGVGGLYKMSEKGVEWEKKLCKQKF